MTGRVSQRYKHLLGPGTVLVHIGLHGRVAAGIAVLGAQALENALGRVPLLRRRGAVGRQDLVDDRSERAELGAGRRLGPPVARRHREGQHLAYSIAVNAKAPRRLALAQPLDMAGVANPSVELHREHPRPLRPVAHEPKEGNDPVQFCTGAAGLPGRLSGTLSQCRTHKFQAKILLPASASRAAVELARQYPDSDIPAEEIATVCRRFGFILQSAIRAVRPAESRDEGG